LTFVFLKIAVAETVVAVLGSLHLVLRYVGAISAQGLAKKLEEIWLPPGC
jgi:hypothetical protein